MSTPRVPAIAEFRDARVLITGACGTLGAWLVEDFARAGARVGAVDVDGHALARLDSAHGLSGSAGGFAHEADLSTDGGLASVVDVVRSRWGCPNILVNNAGIYPPAGLLDAGNDIWDRIFAVNVRAPFALGRDMARLMIAAGVSGTIVNVTSGAATVVRPDLVPYCASKHALAALTRGFALELAPHGIRVNAVSPGFMPRRDAPAEALAARRAATPLGRFARQGDATAAVFYLCSEAAGFVTGVTIDTDGGYRLTGAAIDPSANAHQRS